MKTQSKSKIYSSLILSLVALAVVLPGVFSLQTSVINLPGKIDFVQYWAALRLILEGQNPYNPELLASYEALADNSPRDLIRMWNPPLTPLLLAPICLFEFKLASSLWLGLQLLVVCILSIRLLEEFNINQRATRLQALSTLAIFYPLHSSLYLGQVSALLLLGIVLLFLGVRSASAVLSGSALIFCSVKPHLFLFLYGYILWKFRDRARLLLSAAGILFTALIVPVLFKSDIYSDWLSALSLHSADVRQSNSAWMTATVGTWLRVIFSDSPIDSRWIQFIPLITGFLISIYAISCRFSSEKKFMLILCTSVACSPYAWLFDFLVLFVVHIWLLSKATNISQQAFLFLFQVFTLVLGSSYLDAQHHYFWYPWIYLIAVITWPDTLQSAAGTED